MRGFLIAVSAAGMMVAGAAVAQAPEALPTYRDVGLDWKVMPKQKDMDRHYPVRAANLGVFRGYARVSCTADAQGRLRCRTLEESPKGYYFGAAAIRVMQNAQVRAVDGGSPEGRTFGYGLRFGNWSAWDLPDLYHPSHELRWASMPRLGSRWNLSRQNKGETFSATFDCTARADGSLDCTVKDAEARNPAFVPDALAAMNAARVERADGRSPAGSRFEWERKILRTSYCAGGRHTTGVEKIDPPSEKVTLDEGVASGPPEDLNGTGSAGGSMQGSYSISALPRCRASFVHLRD